MWQKSKKEPKNYDKEVVATFSVFHGFPDVTEKTETERGEIKTQIHFNRIQET